MTDSIMLQETVDTADCSDSAIFEAPKTGALTKAQGLKLLSRLAEDEAFRRFFESAPAQALTDIGVSSLQIATLRADCLAPRMLASQQQLRAAYQRLLADIDASLLIFVIPTAKV